MTSLPQSPLTSTAIIALLFGALAVPLRCVTGEKVANTPQVWSLEKTAAQPKIRSLLRIKTLSKVADVKLSLPSGEVLFAEKSLAAGETEKYIETPSLASMATLKLEATLPEGADTAIFATLIPDKEDEQTAYAIGAGKIVKLLKFHRDTK